LASSGRREWGYIRALAVEAESALVWFWIGSHADYDKLIDRKPAPKRMQPARAKRPSKGKGRTRG